LICKQSILTDYRISEQKSDTFRAAGGEGEARVEVTKYIQREKEELALLQFIQV
jgi:hypothetical protein